MYKTCLVALDKSTFDKHIISEIAVLKDQMTILHTLFAHVDQSKTASSLQHETSIRGESGASDGIKHLTHDRPDSGVIEDVNIIYLEGQPELALAECVKENEVDLVCVGLRSKGSSSSQVGRRLLCITPADVLFVPLTTPKKVQKILIPVDLSDKARALVIKIQKQFPSADLHLYFVNYIPSPLVMAEEDRKQLIAESSRNLNISMQHFIDSIISGQNSLSYEYGMSEHFNAGIAIHEHALKNDFDLVAIGRLSKLDKELPFLGSVTEKLLGFSNNIPVLVLNH